MKLDVTLSKLHQLLSPLAHNIKPTRMTHTPKNQYQKTNVQELTEKQMI